MDKFKLTLLLSVLSVFDWSSGEAMWSKFATSQYYQNFILLVEDSESVLASIYYPGLLGYFHRRQTKFLVWRGVVWAQMYCARECIELSECNAFNFKTNESHHTCELLADNFCATNWGRLTLFTSAGSLLFDKLKDNSTQSCIDQLFSSGPTAMGLCETARPGCTGTWPNCDSCVQTCIDCSVRYNKSEAYECTLWPGGTFAQPIFAYCYGRLTYLMRRAVDVGSGNVTLQYMMDFVDMNRLIELKVYTKLQFYYQLYSEKYFGYYANPYISPDGTLSNLTFLSSSPSPSTDWLKLNGQQIVPAPFIWVDIPDDIHSCGSFWRMNASNAINCPGGDNLGLFGKVKRSSMAVVCTGIQWPGAASVNLNHGDVGLTT